MTFEDFLKDRQPRLDLERDPRASALHEGDPVGPEGPGELSHAAPRLPTVSSTRFPVEILMEIL